MHPSEIKVLQTLVKQRKESIDLYESGGRNELAEAEQKELEILNNYLPKMMDEIDIKNIVKSVRNLPNVKLINDAGTNVYDLVKYKNVLFTTTSIKNIQDRLK